MRTRTRGQPYAMNYTDEVAQALGVDQGGRMDAFRYRHIRQRLDVPALKGGGG